MKDVSEKNNLLKPAKVGEIVQGIVISKERGALFLDLGPTGTGIIYGKEFYEAKGILKDLEMGDKVFAKIIDLENEDGYIELSISQAGKELTWEELKLKKEKGEIISVKILGANKGGLLAEISGIPGFLPVSQLSPANYPKVEGGETAKILRELQKFIGKEMKVQIFDLDPKIRKLILSERSKEAERIKEFLRNYKVGDVVEGEITGIVDFGAFVKFPLPSDLSAEAQRAKADLSADLRRPEPTSVGEGRSLAKTEALVKEDFSSETELPVLEGLIHISELDWRLIEDPSEIVKVGQIVQAKIIDILGDKVSLSLKALKKDPWQDIEKKYKKGDRVSGTATKLNPFGAFVQLSPEIQGLCHISEFGTKTKMEAALKIGKKYDFQILEIWPEEHRMSLKLVSEE